MDKDFKLVVEKLIKKVYLLNLKRHKKQKISFIIDTGVCGKIEEGYKLH